MIFSVLFYLSLYSITIELSYLCLAIAITTCFFYMYVFYLVMTITTCCFVTCTTCHVLAQQLQFVFFFSVRITSCQSNYNLLFCSLYMVCLTLAITTYCFLPVHVRSCNSNYSFLFYYLDELCLAIAIRTCLVTCTCHVLAQQLQFVVFFSVRITSCQSNYNLLFWSCNSNYMLGLAIAITASYFITQTCYVLLYQLELVLLHVRVMACPINNNNLLSSYMYMLCPVQANTTCFFTCTCYVWPYQLQLVLLPVRVMAYPNNNYNLLSCYLYVLCLALAITACCFVT